MTHATVSSFKGLESDYVVLTDIDSLDTRWWRSVAYVGMSRARVKLYLFLSRDCRPILESRTRQWISTHVNPGGFPSAHVHMEESH